MPNYNSITTVISSLISIKNQTFEFYECIIVDDNSSDESLHLIEEFVKEDKRFKLIKSRINRGVSFSRNIGISKAKGRYLAFLDSDDIWDEKFLENNLSIRLNQDIPISHSPYIRFKILNSTLAKGVVVNTPQIIDNSNILKKNFLPLLSVFLDRNIVGDINFKDIRPEDYDLWIDLIKERNFYSISTNKIACFYRISYSQRSKNKIKSFVRIFKFYNRKLKINNIIAFFYGLRWMAFNIFSRFKRFKDLKYLNTSDKILNLILDKDLDK